MMRRLNRPARPHDAPGRPGGPRTPCTVPRSACTAQRPRVRALCAAFPSRFPLVPALTRSLRAASVFLTSPPPHGDPRARSGTLQLCSTSKQAGGGPIRKRTGGKPGTPRAPQAARFQVFPQTPIPVPPARQFSRKRVRKCNQDAPVTAIDLRCVPGCSCC
jgi:hypothetical protein